ncbi:hypothetical protein ACLNGM_17055 [Aureimonas phyllosphaerae]|uniref:hypothetical protein n=1 Tax=Aureimonas phyllosphaerae TaxID=1166078 RepID=UPI003A5C6FCA
MSTISEEVQSFRTIAAARFSGDGLQRVRHKIDDLERGCKRLGREPTFTEAAEWGEKLLWFTLDGLRSMVAKHLGAPPPSYPDGHYFSDAEVRKRERERDEDTARFADREERRRVASGRRRAERKAARDALPKAARSASKRNPAEAEGIERAPRQLTLFE